jgi:hypothetical protein
MAAVAFEVRGGKREGRSGEERRVEEEKEQRKEEADTLTFFKEKQKVEAEKQRIEAEKQSIVQSVVVEQQKLGMLTQALEQQVGWEGGGRREGGGRE